MDSFTERMMNRATTRQVNFEQQMKEILGGDDVGIDDPSLEVILEAKSKEYREILRVGTSRNERDSRQVDDKENDMGKSVISDVTKSRLKKLVPLYTDEDPRSFPSPVGYGRRQAEKELKECELKAEQGRLSAQRSKRLANLANVINNWEDESDKKLPVLSRSEVATAKPVTKPVSSPALKKKMANFDKAAGASVPQKKVVWDDKVLQTLESQGFQRCESEQHLVFDYKSPEKNPPHCSRDARGSPIKANLPSSAGKPMGRCPSPQKPADIRSPLKSATTPIREARPVQRESTPVRRYSPVKQQEVSPSQYKHADSSPARYDSPYRSRSVSPIKSRSVSPVKSRFESPVKSRFESPVKSRSESPVKARSESPDKTRYTKPTLKPESPTKSTQATAFSLMMETLPVKVDPRREEMTKLQSPSKPINQASPKKLLANSAVLEMAAKYENDSSPPKKVKDPTELSVHDRKAIFERNHGGVLLPKAPFGMPVPAKALQAAEKTRARSPEKVGKLPERVAKKMEWKKEVDAPADSVSQAILERQREIEMLRTRWERKREENVMQGGPTAPMPPQYRDSQKSSGSRSTPSPPPPPAHAANKSPYTPNRIRMGTRSPVRGENSSDSSPVRSPRSPYCSPSKLNEAERYDESYESPNSSPARTRKLLASPRRSTELVAALSSVKKIKISPPKHGRLYPSISDIETESEALDTESEVHESDFDIAPRGSRGGYCSDSEESAFSLGQAVVRRARQSQSNLKRGIPTSSLRSSPTSTCTDTTAQESRILHEMDDFLDEALGEVSPPKKSRECLFPKDPKVLQPSAPSCSSHSDSFEYEPKGSAYIAEKKIPLVHTVSTYRKLESQRTPRKELYEMEIEAERALKDETPENVLVGERIFELEQEMIKQTTIISQATQALNLCHARPEFAGSMEQVEAEKLLLIATSRRTAALREIERLKVEKTFKPGGMSSNTDKGNLTIEYVSLPIKMCPTEPDKTDHFMCMVTSGTTVQATQVLALKKHNLTRGNRLAFTKPLTLDNLFCDFTVTIEVFRLTCKNAMGSSADCKEEKKALSKLRLTPQKKNPRHRMPIESPGGPNSVRSPSFQMVGFVVFSLREVKRNKFTLNKVPYGAPLDGTIELSMSSALKSEIEYRGFLTQFEEVSGFGAWKRKWALLKGSTITFWVYPEHEEHRKIPIDTIDLGTIKTKEVGLVSRDVCARPHTFLLETDCGERKLLSADTLEDRLAWTKAINKSLQLIRAWGGRPY